MFLLLFYHFFFSLNKDSCSIVSSKLHEAYITYFMEETDTRNWHSTAGRYTQFSWILILHIAKYNVIYRAYLTAPAKVSPISSPLDWPQSSVAHSNTHRRDGEAAPLHPDTQLELQQCQPSIKWPTVIASIYFSCLSVSLLLSVKIQKLLTNVMVLFLHHKEENERAWLDLYQNVLKPNEATLLKTGGTVVHVRTALGLSKW